MAGGKGTRLAPFTKVLPKPLLPINEKPVIEHIIEKFFDYGIANFYITVNYKSLLLKSFFTELKPNYSVKFLGEKKPLGTVGCLKNYRKYFKNSFFVCNCDVIVDVDYNDVYNFHQKRKNDITIVASTKKFEIPYGVCEINKKGNLKKIVEKPKQNLLANVGLYLLNPRILKLIPKNKYFHMTELIEVCRKKGFKVGVFPINDSDWLDAGQLSAFNT